MADAMQAGRWRPPRSYRVIRVYVRGGELMLGSWGHGVMGSWGGGGLECCFESGETFFEGAGDGE